MRVLASEEGWPLADIRGPGNCFWNVIFQPKTNLLPAVLPWSLSMTVSLMRRVLEMDLKPCVPAPGLPFMLCDSALSRCQGRVFITLVTLSLAMGISLACSGLALASLWERIFISDDPYELEHQRFWPKMEIFLFFKPYGVSFLGVPLSSPSALIPSQLSTHCQDH